VLGLLWFLQRRFARGAARKRGTAPIEVLGRQSLGAKAQLVVVQTEDARYVLGVTEHGVSVVDKLDPAAPEEPDAAAEPVSGTTAPSGADAFDSILSRTASAHGQAPELRRRVRHRSDPLRGSIISPQTWRQTAEALRRPR